MTDTAAIAAPRSTRQPRSIPAAERIPRTVLVAPDHFDATLTADAVARAIGEGLQELDVPVDLCPLDDRRVLDAPNFEIRMRATRAVVTGTGRLVQHSLAGTPIAEVATRARQRGVPCHAVVGHHELDAFGARVLDLQLILEAPDEEALRAAGRQLAQVLAVRS